MADKEYIEREAAIKEFNLYFGGVSHAVIAKQLLDSIPTADVVEVRHGHWIKITSYPMGRKCSECGYIKQYAKPYCEICGAKMDGKGEGECRKY